MKKVELGQVVMTAGVERAINEDLEFVDFVYRSLWQRYCNADWGEMCEADLELNDYALEGGDRLFGSYTIPERYAKIPHDKLWIITEWDRSVTTLLFPEEY